MRGVWDLENIAEVGMTLNDPLAQALSNIQNAEMVGKTECITGPSSHIIKSVLHILKDKSYIGDFIEIVDNRGNSLRVNLLGRINKCGVIKPRYPITYKEMEKFEKRYLPAKDLGIIIITTSNGIITHTEAKQKNIGGKLLAYCY